jgi:hypothetical protein
MPGGRPRTVSFDEKKMIFLGKEMVEFVRRNQSTILHLSEWYTIHKGFTYKQWETFIQREEFIPYYETALKIVGLKYVDKTSNVRDSIANRWQRIYFKDLRKREDEDADVEQLRKASALKGDARAQEEERQRVLDEVQRNKRTLK